MDAELDALVEFATTNHGTLLCVVGPTASGKTELAIRLCERIGGEIVSADSIQVYRGFDVGSGKPDAEERRRAPHHVIDILDPHEAIDAAAYARIADRAIEDIRSRGRVPVVCGGTFFWVRALVLGLADAPPADPEVRERHRRRVDAEGRARLHEDLARVDPESAARLHPNDVVRVSRALEVFELTGRKLSALHQDHGFRGQRHPARLVGRAHAPDALTARIAARVDGWLAGAWMDEVAALMANGHGSARAMGSVGYAEVRDHLLGRLPRDELRDAIVRSTRVFARRQRTWLNQADVLWL